MTAYIPKPQDIYDFPIDALDAAFMLHCRDNKSIYPFRQEEILGKLIIYKISGATAATQHTFIGEVRFQFINSEQTRISYNTPKSLPPTWDTKNWVNHDREYLQQFCMSVIDDLNRFYSEKEMQRSYQRGRLPLKQNEIARRVAMAILEDKLKEKRKKVAADFMEKIMHEKRPSKEDMRILENQFKNGATRWRNAILDKDEELLADAQELVNSWFPILST
jgi:hypothetical protein